MYHAFLGLREPKPVSSNSRYIHILCTIVNLFVAGKNVQQQRDDAKRGTLCFHASFGHVWQGRPTFWTRDKARKQAKEEQ
jgi:hypothetical protein